MGGWVVGEVRGVGGGFMVEGWGQEVGGDFLGLGLLVFLWTRLSLDLFSLRLNHLYPLFLYRRQDLRARSFTLIRNRFAGEYLNQLRRPPQKIV